MCIFPLHAETQFPDGHFSLSALARLEAQAGINIFKELQSSHIEDIAAATSLQLPDIYRHNLVDCCKLVFKDWVAGQSSLPHVWANLLQVLRNLDMEDMAKRIELYFLLTTRSKSKMEVSELMGEEKELMDSLQQTLTKVERDLRKSEGQNQLLKIENETLHSEIEVLKQNLSVVESSGML